MRYSVVNRVATILVTVCITSLVMESKSMSQSDTESKETRQLTQSQAAAFAKLALKGIVQEFPNKPSNVMDSAADVRSPKAMHPVFYGSFDWHSSVHGHWMLARLLRLFPDADNADEIRTALNEQLTAEKLAKEAEYFAAKYNRSFERMYGWAWLMQLVSELESWDDVDAKRWLKNLRPLEEQIVKRMMDYLPKLQFPIRTGVHQDTGFALGMLLDYARSRKGARETQGKTLEGLLVDKAKQFYSNDLNYPAHYEPSGHDFFSSGFNEADLMRRVLTGEKYVAWLDGFLPQLAKREMGAMMTPVEVSDVTDGHLVHLAGLNLSRAWTMKGIADALPESDPRVAQLRESIKQHAQAGLKYVTSGHYEGEHWLATFAVYHLSR